MKLLKWVCFWKKEGFTWLGFFNYYMLQFLFIRITRCHERKIVEAKFFNVSITPYGYSMCFDQVKYKHMQWYAIQYWIMPFSGYGGPFRCPNRWGHPIYLNITKKKEVKP